MVTCRKCQKEFSIHIKIDGIKRNLCNRKYCLDCSPFKEHNTAKLELVLNYGKTCHACNIIKPTTEFYIKSKDKKPTSYCINCNKLNARKKQQTLKLEAIKYKGGFCILCKYDKCVSALEFHHLNPNEKEFDISSTRTILLDKIKTELDKCVLLCCRCHVEVHHDLRKGIDILNNLETLN